MSYAIKIGTISASYIHDAPTPTGCVRYDGELPHNPIWDAGLQNIREMTQQEIDALPAQKVVADRAVVVAKFSNPNDLDAKAIRALGLAVLDELNAHALKINAILDAVDGAASLAALKTAVAAIADYPQRTKAQVANVMTTHINAGDADT